MKKILLLITLIFLTTACTSEVNLTITDDYIDEEINIYEDITSEQTTETILTKYRNYMPLYEDEVPGDEEPDIKVSGVKYYKRFSETSNNKVKVEYSNRYTYSEYLKANSLASNFQSYSIINSYKDNLIEISTDSGGLLSLSNLDDLTNVRINITTEYEVLKNNADTVHGNTYTWYFTKTNNKKGIHMTIKKSKTKQEEPEKEKQDNKEQKEVDEEEKKSLDPLVILLIIGILLILLLLIFSKKK